MTRFLEYVHWVLESKREIKREKNMKITTSTSHAVETLTMYHNKSKIDRNQKKIERKKIKLVHVSFSTDATLYDKFKGTKTLTDNMFVDSFWDNLQNVGPEDIS